MNDEQRWMSPVERPGDYRRADDSCGTRIEKHQADAMGPPAARFLFQAASSYNVTLTKIQKTRDYALCGLAQLESIVLCCRDLAFLPRSCWPWPGWQRRCGHKSRGRKLHPRSAS